MTPDEINIYAKLNLCELILRDFLSNQFAHLPDATEALEAYRKEFLHRLQFGLSTPPNTAPDSPQVTALQSACIALAEQFFAKAAQDMEHVQALKAQQTERKKDDA